ncbi:hypothetical protein GGF31_002736 [Allomyces arbusculus]|nr:hypothetical protein GGF31_002736 [Allomyces arbusculus]
MKLTALFVVAAAAASGLVTANKAPASEDAFYDDVSASTVAAPVMTATRPAVMRNDGPITYAEFGRETMALLAKMSPLQRQATAQWIRQQRQQQKQRQEQQQQKQQKRKQRQERRLRAQCVQLAKEDGRASLLSARAGAGAQASRRLSPMEEMEQMQVRLREAMARRPAPRAPPRAPQPAPWTPKVAWQPIPYKFPPPPPAPRVPVYAPPPPPAPRAPPVYSAPVAPHKPFLGQVKLPFPNAPNSAVVSPKLSQGKVSLPTDPAKRDQLRARCTRLLHADRLKAAGIVPKSAPGSMRTAPITSASAPVMTASGPFTITRGIIRQPRIHGKPGTGQKAKTRTAGTKPVRKGTTVRQTIFVNKPGMPRKRKTTAELLRDRINALPVGSPLRVTYERRLARLQAAKSGGAAGQKPKTWSAGIPRIRKPGTIVRKPKTVRKTFVVVKKTGGAPRKRKTTAELLRDRINALPVGSPLRVTYERRLARLQAAKSGGAAGQKPKVATTTTPLMSLAGSGYDYASLDDAWGESYDDMWDDAYDGGDFSVEDAYGEDAADDEYDGSDFSVSEDAAYEGDDMWEDNYDEGFSVSEDAAYEGDDMWEDNYDGDFAVADEAGPAGDVDDEAEDAYDGGDFSVSEDAYGGDDMWDDAYDGEGYSVEDTFTEDAADDEY